MKKNYEKPSIEFVDFSLDDAIMSGNTDIGMGDGTSNFDPDDIG